MSTTSREITADLTRCVRSIRGHRVALRRLAKSRPVRNAGATRRAVAFHERELARLELGLVVIGQHGLVGELVEESKLVERLAEAKQFCQDRPELRQRLAATRARIRRLAGM